jgi:hypothetical protein
MSSAGSILRGLPVEDLGTVGEGFEEVGAKNGLLDVGTAEELGLLMVFSGIRGGSIAVMTVDTVGSGAQYDVENGSMDFSFGSVEVRYAKI